MSARLPADAKSGGSSFYEQHQQQLQSHQQHATMPSTTTEAVSSTMQQIHAAALQQRLQDYHQQRPPPGAYDACYYPNGSTSYMHRSHSSSPYSYAVPHYASTANYLGHPHPHPHANLGQTSPYAHHHADYGLLAHRTRFLPYAQQSTHLRHSMFTPAGQQLMPSSVLHYPPRCSSIYLPHSSEDSMHLQQPPPPPPPPPPPHMYDFRSEPHAQYHLQQRQPYMPMHHETSHGTYNPYAISQHHYQQSQSLLQSSSTSMQASVIGNEARPRQAPLTHSTKITNAIPELRTASISGEATVIREEICKKELEVDVEQKISYATPQQRSTDSVLTTTSPPLISGTDSGISCCSTRGTHNDSTHSTPVYCGGDYQPPMSVDSTASSTLPLADAKEFDEISNETKVKENYEFPSESPLTTKEAAGNTKHAANSHDRANDDNAAGAKLKQTEKAKTDAKEKEMNKIFHTKNHVQDTIASQSSTISTSGKSTISSPTNERCTTPFQHLTSPKSFQKQPQQQKHQSPKHQQQQQQQQQQQKTTSFKKQRNHDINSSWSPFSTSPNNWTQQSNNSNYLAAADNRAPSQKSPPRVPVPPHNSPVDYAPLTTMPPLYHPAAVATNKNRIIECDLIPSKKSKRSCSTEAREVREEIRNITPLPGFQQAFGSTEIGRFSETFLHSPPVSVSGAADQTDAYSEQMLMQRAWPSYPFETFDFNGPRGRSKGVRDSRDGRGSVSQFNLQQFGSRPTYGDRTIDMMAYERHGYGGRVNGGFTEIRCNGY